MFYNVATTYVNLPRSSSKRKRVTGGLMLMLSSHGSSEICGPGEAKKVPPCVLAQNWRAGRARSAKNLKN